MQSQLMLERTQSVRVCIASMHVSRNDTRRSPALHRWVHSELTTSEHPTKPTRLHEQAAMQMGGLMG
jgi:hypothetical protein